LSRPTDDAKTNPLPDPELNPLVNPLLAAHMGRWAEVYFTAPPEKRSQAVADLIRELENSPSGSVPAQVTSDQKNQVEDQKPQNLEETAKVSKPNPIPETARSCSTCGYENPAEQKFCGMCGAALDILQAGRIPRGREAAPREARWSEPELAPRTESAFYYSRPAAGENAVDEVFDSDDSAWRLAENQIPSFAMESEPASSRYRMYVGIVLAVLLGLLVYMGWRGTKAISSASSPQPLPSKVMPAAPTATEEPVRPPKTTPSESSADHTSPPKPSRTQPETTPRQEQAAASPPASQIVSRAVSSPAIASESSGADDLATAERYLNAGQGRARDSSEAALWLWKATGKGNPAATMILSDLYLRGDGVPKSCDQARLLLNAAARKGSKAAGERLRNLPAFGCE